VTIGAAVYKYLTTYAGLTALISTRVYPDVLPQSVTYPCVSFEAISEEEIESFQTASSTLIGVTYSFSCWAATRASARAISEQIRTAFKNYSGVMGGAGGVTVSAVEKISRIDSTVQDSDGRIIAYLTTIDFQIWYQE
jgi:hypothetical protein